MRELRKLRRHLRCLPFVPSGREWGGRDSAAVRPEAAARQRGLGGRATCPQRTTSHTL